MRHTAGPWSVHPVNAQVDAFVGGEPLPVCQLLWPTTERTEAETEANASLIAAAPDLLAALKAVTDHFAAVMGGPYRASGFFASVIVIWRPRCSDSVGE